MRQMLNVSLAVTLLLATLAAPSAARRGLRFSPTSTRLGLAIQAEIGGGTPGRCVLGLEETLHESVAKAAGTLLGTANVSLSCEFGMGLLVGGRRVTGPQGPYHLTYTSFAGTLPNITAVTRRVKDLEVWTAIAGSPCLSDGTIDLDITTTGGNPATGAQLTPQSIPLTGEFECIFSSIEVTGVGSLSPSVRISLV